MRSLCNAVEIRQNLVAGLLRPQRRTQRAVGHHVGVGACLVEQPEQIVLTVSDLQQRVDILLDRKPCSARKRRVERLVCIGCVRKVEKAVSKRPTKRIDPSLRLGSADVDHREIRRHVGDNLSLSATVDRLFLVAKVFGTQRHWRLGDKLASAQRWINLFVDGRFHLQKLARKVDRLARVAGESPGMHQAVKVSLCGLAKTHDDLVPYDLLLISTSAMIRSLITPDERAIT